LHRTIYAAASVLSGVCLSWSDTVRLFDAALYFWAFIPQSKQAFSHFDCLSFTDESQQWHNAAHDDQNFSTAVPINVLYQLSQWEMEGHLVRIIGELCSPFAYAACIPHSLYFDRSIVGVGQDIRLGMSCSSPPLDMIVCQLLSTTFSCGKRRAWRDAYLQSQRTFVSLSHQLHAHLNLSG
jgi:hypothetical protein